MSNSRKIKIFADATNLGSAKNLETNDLINFRRGDSLEIAVAFLQDGKVYDFSSAISATLEILDIGGFNAVNPREVSLLMRKECNDFSSLQKDLSLKDITSMESLPAVFSFEQSETSIAAGEKWLRIFADFADGSRITFASGWINVLENYSAEPDLLPFDNPRYYTKNSADETFLAISKNLSDLTNVEIARNSLNVYSKDEANGLINQAVAGSHSHSEYLEKSLNLADLQDVSSALNNLGGVSNSQFKELKNVVSKNQNVLENLSFLKATSASAKLHKGYLKTNVIDWNGGVFSFCFGLKVDEKPNTSTPIFSVLDVLKLYATQEGFEVYVNIENSTFTAISSYENANFEFGKFNSIICVVDFKNSITKLFVNGLNCDMQNSGKMGSFKKFSSTCLFGFDGNLLADKIEFSRIKIFNSNLADENPIYLVEDFASGKDEDYFLRKGRMPNTDENLGASTSGGWANATATRGVWRASINANGSKYIANADLSDDAEAESLGIDYAIDYSSVASSVNPAGYPAPNFLYNNTINLNEFVGKVLRARISFYAKKLNASSDIFIRAGNAGKASAKIETFEASLFNNDTWTFVDKTVEFTVPDHTGNIRISIVAPEADSTSAGAYRIAKFNFELQGTLASFDMNANSNQLKDISANENYLIAFENVEFSSNKNPSHCVELFSWAGTQVAQESSILLPKNSIVQIFAKSTSVISILASVNSITNSALLAANTLTKIGEWLVSSDNFATLTPSEIFTGKIEFFYKIERL